MRISDTAETRRPPPRGGTCFDVDDCVSAPSLTDHESSSDEQLDDGDDSAEPDDDDDDDEREPDDERERDFDTEPEPEYSSNAVSPQLPSGLSSSVPSFESKSGADPVL
jgi:hypothetical protein